MSPETLILTVLMVGHSLIGREQPRMLEQLLQASAPQARVEEQVINGAPLRWNWEHSAEAQGVDGRAFLHETPVDALILTEAIPLANHIEWSAGDEAGGRFAALARDANPDTRVFLLETWHSLDQGAQPWREQIEADLPAWQGLADGIAAESGAEVALIPAGQAMGDLHDAIEDGEVPGLERIEDLFEDDIHPNDLGHYFVALVAQAVLTGAPATPPALTGRWDRAYSAASPELRAALARIAADAAAEAAPRPARQKAQVSTDAAPAAPAAAGPDLPPPPDPGTGPLGMNLAGVNDWSVQQPFIDVFRTARSWIGHLPGRWGGADEADLRLLGVLDENGWPTRVPGEFASIGTLILTDLPEEASELAGRYVLRFEGDGIVEVGGLAQNVRYGPNEVRFDFAPGEGMVIIRIQRSDRRGTGDHVRNITVMREDLVARHEAGDLFRPGFVEALSGYDLLRFMDWMETNHSEISEWSDRPRVEDYTWSRRGVPLEVMLALAERTGADPWFTLPHLADDDYIRRFAEAVRDGLAPGLTAHVELSNEVWNWQFAQARWAGEQAEARWGSKEAWMQVYGGRAAEMAAIWRDVFAGTPDRLVTVIATQLAWLGLEDQALEAPLWRAGAAGRRPPAEAFDAYAVAAYFGGALGLEENAAMLRDWLAQSRDAAEREAAARGLPGAARADYIAAHRFDLAERMTAAELLDGGLSGSPTGSLAELTGRLLPHHAEVARRYGLRLVAYEGGSHLAAIGPILDDPAVTDFLTHMTFSEEMGALYRHLLAGWTAAEGDLFAAYNDLYAPSKWGSWGAQRWPGDDNPRWRALRAYAGEAE